MHENNKLQWSPLVVQPLPGIGDAMWYLPHMRAIADQSPTKKIVLLTKQSSKADELFLGEEFIESYIWLQRDRRSNASKQTQRHQGLWGGLKLALHLKSYNFQKAWILHHSPFYANVCKWAGIKSRIGYTSRRWGHSLTQPLLINKSALLTPREKSTALLEAHHLWLDHYDYPLQINPQVQCKTQELFNTSQILVKVVLGIGASGPEKCWPIEKFIQLTKWLLTQNCQVILCGGRGEQKSAALIIANCAHHNLLNCTNQTLQETIAIIQQGNIYIGNDTSLMNIAVNQRKKSWVFFGPTYTVYSDLILPLIASSQHLQDIAVEQVQCDVKEYLLKYSQDALV